MKPLGSGRKKRKKERLNGFRARGLAAFAVHVELLYRASLRYEIVLHYEMLYEIVLFENARTRAT